MSTEGGDRAGSIEPGTEIAGYRVEAVVGRGGMGVVYRAHDLALDRKVALKLLAPELAEDERFRERFHRESRLAASLDHPSVIPIYDGGEASGRLFLAMRLVDGTDLKRLLAEEGTFPPERAIRILSQVADALDAAHERGLVHRDVKPSNVLIDKRDHVYLADFGLSRLLGEAGASTTDVRTLGTVGYVSPEQIRGEEVGARSDLYSLGCMLYECLAGRPPFTGSDTAVAFAHLDQPPPPLSGPDQVLGRALAKDPAERFASGRELIDAAGAALGTGRKRRWAIAGGVLAAAAASAVVATLLVTRSSGPAVDRTLSSLVRIDATTGRVTSTTPAGHGATAVAAHGSDVWVANGADGSVWLFRGGTKPTRRIPVTGHPDGVATDGHQVLVASSDARTLTLLDPKTGSVIATRGRSGDPKGPIRVGAGPVTMRYADASPGVVGSILPRSSSGVDISEGAVPRSGRSFLGDYESFGGIAIDNAASWTSGGVFDRGLYRIPTTIPGPQAPVLRVPLPFAPGPVAAGGGLVWTAGLMDDRVVTIDPSFGRNRIIGNVAVPRGVIGLAYASGTLWIASSIDPVVSRFDLRSGKITATIPVTGIPVAIAASGDNVWVATRPVPSAPSGSGAVVGLLTDCRSADPAAARRSLAGAWLPLIARGARRGKAIRDSVVGASVAGKDVVVHQGCADGTALSALREARRLVETDGVKVLVGPQTATEELALADYARRHPEVTFVDGSAGAELHDPPANWFTFHLDEAQSMAGLGAYAYRKLGWRHAAIVAERSDPIRTWAEAAGFVREFCALGGTIEGRSLVPTTARSFADFDKVVASVPWSKVDGLVALTVANGFAGKDVLTAIYRHKFNPNKLFQSQLLLGPYVVGIDPSSPLAHGVPWRGTGPETVAYRAALKRSFPEVDSAPGQDDVAYHDAMDAVLRALESAKGDLAAASFRAALATTVLTSPDGRVTLDASHRAQGRNLVYADPFGSLLETVTGVGSWPGATGDPGIATPACVAGNLPQWVR